MFLEIFAEFPWSGKKLCRFCQTRLAKTAKSYRKCQKLKTSYFSQKLSDWLETWTEVRYQWEKWFESKKIDIQHHDVTWRHNDVINDFKDQNCWLQHIFGPWHHWYVFFRKEDLKTKKMRGQPFSLDVLLKSYNNFRIWHILMTSSRWWRHCDVTVTSGGA